MSSSSASAFRFTPTRNSSSGIRRAPRTLATSTSAPSTSSGGSASPAGDAVPRFPPIVPRLRICGEPTVRDASASAGSASASSPLIASVYVSPAPSRSVPFSRDQPRSSATSFRLRSDLGPRAIEVERDHHVGSALDRERVRVLGLQPSASSSERGREDVHADVLPLLANVRNPERRRRAEPPLREAGRDEHQHDDRHHVREGVEELGRHVAPREPGARTGAPTALRRDTRRRDRARRARTRRSRGRSRSSPLRRRACRPTVQPGVIERL